MERYKSYFKELEKVDDNTSMDDLVRLSNKKAGRDRNDAILELCKRAKKKSGKDCRTLAMALNILDVKGNANKGEYEESTSTTILTYDEFINELRGMKIKNLPLDFQLSKYTDRKDKIVINQSGFEPKAIARNFYGKFKDQDGGNVEVRKFIETLYNKYGFNSKNYGKQLNLHIEDKEVKGILFSYFCEKENEQIEFILDMVD